MILKQIPEDFRVDEVYDLEHLKNQEEEIANPRFHYFILTKKDYTVNRAIEQICRSFKIQIRDVHFAGTKDRQAISTQLISLRRLRHGWEEDVRKFNEHFNDLKLEFVGMFPRRLALGDNIGNKFTITLRDLTNEEIEIMKKNFSKIQKKGVLNYFDSQRFGFMGKNPVIGKYLLRGDFEKALFNILIAAPENRKEEHDKFIKYLEENWKEIVKENKWDEVIKKIPSWLNQEIVLLEHLKKYKNDFLGAISLLQKKIRTMYVYSYQSYLFNETLKFLDKKGEAENYEELKLVSSESVLDGEIEELTKHLLSLDGLNLKSFEMPRSPTLKPKEVLRKVWVDVKNLKIIEIADDELNSKKQKVVLSFELGSGEYATNVIKCLFEE